MMVATETMFKTHLYKFGGKMFQQLLGGPIGLRGTCAIARLVMCVFDRLWKGIMKDNGIGWNLYLRYMDDGRIFLHAIKAGWRWNSGRLEFQESWKEEDAKLEPLEITRRALAGSMEGVISCLKFTTEVGTDYDDNCLPTLDLKLWVEKDNKVLYKFYEKPTVANVAVQSRSAMEENGKVKVNSNDQVRRLLRTSRQVGMEEWPRVVDQYAKKLMTSGFKKDQVTRMVVAGIKGYEGKLERCKLEGKKLYRTAEESGPARLRKKLAGSTEWYRRKRKEGTEVGMNMNKKKGRQGSNNNTIPTRSVMFVEYTPGGKLAKELREVLSGIEHILGFRIKVVERSGTAIARKFPLTQLWEGQPCGRLECVTCLQGGEKVPPCTRRNVTYENYCLICNPKAVEGKEVVPTSSVPSIYVGGSWRSLAEREGEHWKTYKAGREDSHILKHHMVHHGGVGTPRFHLRPLKFHRTALERQVAEAVRIKRRGGRTAY